MKGIISILWIILSCMCALHAQSDFELAEEGVSIDRLKSHIYFLASDFLKGRNTPSDELNIAAEYIKTRFQAYGIEHAPGMESYYQTVPLEIISPANEARMAFNEIEFNFPDDFLLLDGDNTSLKAPVVFVGYGTEEDFESSEIEGKIAVSLCGDGESAGVRSWFRIARNKRKIAAEKGAIALVEIYASARTPFSVLKRFFGPRKQYSLADTSQSHRSPLPHVWMSATDSTLVSRVKMAADQMSIQIDGVKREIINSRNIVGYKEGTDTILKTEIIVYSAHYDHIGIGNANAQGDSIYNGARDNAVGTSTVLSIAENIGLHPTRRSALFVLFTGEEKGLLGSNWFVDHSPISLSDLVYCFNSDNAGYNDTTRATIIGLTRTTAEPFIEKACTYFGLEAMEDSAPEQGLFDRSDNVNFARKGIPAPTFSLGFTKFDSEIFKYYHQPSDHPDNINYNYLERFFKAYVLSSRLIANADETPFWKEGDKYYKAGEDLYK